MAKIQYEREEEATLHDFNTAWFLAPSSTILFAAPVGPHLKAKLVSSIQCEGVATD